MSELCVFSCDFGLQSQEMYRLLLSAKKVDIDIKVYGTKVWPGWAKAKISHALEFIKNHESTHFLYTDGYDSFFVRGEKEIMDAFRKINSPILIQAEKNCWPDSVKADDYPICATPWKYLCAGGWMGAKEPLITALEQMEKSQYFETQDDQRCWTEFYLHDPVAAAWVEIDHHCEVFQSMYMTDDTEISPEGQNLVTGTYPAIVHFNGNRMRLNDYYSRLTKLPVLQTA